MPSHILNTPGEAGKSSSWGPSNRWGEDGINDFVVGGIRTAVNPDRRGTKAASYYHLTVGAGASQTLMLRLTNRRLKRPFSGFDKVFRSRIDEADEFYAELQEGISDDDARSLQRQAFAGMLWSRQFYYSDVPTWLKGDPHAH